jgi:hypothetical protein
MAGGGDCLEVVKFLDALFKVTEAEELFMIKGFESVGGRGKQGAFEDSDIKIKKYSFKV